MTININKSLRNHSQLNHFGVTARLKKNPSLHGVISQPRKTPSLNSPHGQTFQLKKNQNLLSLLGVTHQPRSSQNLSHYGAMEMKTTKLASLVRSNRQLRVKSGALMHLAPKTSEVGETPKALTRAHTAVDLVEAEATTTIMTAEVVVAAEVATSEVDAEDSTM
jgi:hypothetical protein